MRSTCKKTIAILNAIPYLENLIDVVYAITYIRGFDPESIHDAKIEGDNITFTLVHWFHPSLSTLVEVELSFKELIKNPVEYLGVVIAIEKKRVSNDNSEKMDITQQL